MEATFYFLVVVFFVINRMAREVSALFVKRFRLQATAIPM